MRFSKAGLVAASVALFVSGIHAATQTLDGVNPPVGTVVSTTGSADDLIVNADGYRVIPAGTNPAIDILQFRTVNISGAPAGSAVTLVNAFGTTARGGANYVAGDAMQKITFENNSTGQLGRATGHFIFEKTGGGILEYTRGGFRQASGAGYTGYSEASVHNAQLNPMTQAWEDNTNAINNFVGPQGGNTGDFLISNGTLNVRGAINNWIEYPLELSESNVVKPVMSGANRTIVMSGAMLDFTNTELNVDSGASTHFNGPGGTASKRYNFVQNLMAGTNNDQLNARLKTGVDSSYRIVVNIDQSVLQTQTGFDYSLESDGVTARTDAARAATTGSIGIIMGPGDVLKTGPGKLLILNDAERDTGRLILAGGETTLKSITGNTVNEMASINLAGLDAVRGDATRPRFIADAATADTSDGWWTPGVAPDAQKDTTKAGFIASLRIEGNQTIHNFQADYAYGTGVAGTGALATVENAVLAAQSLHADEAIIAGLGNGTTLNLNGQTLTLRQDRDAIYQGSIISADTNGVYLAGGKIIKDGTGTLALIKGGTYDFESIEVRAGTLLASAGALGTGDFIFSGGSLTIVQPDAGNLRANLTGATGTLLITTLGTIQTASGETLAVNGDGTAGSILFDRVQTFSADIIASDGVTLNFSSGYNNAIANAASVTLRAGASNRETRLNIGDSLQILNNLNGDALSRLDLGRGVATLHQTVDSTFAGRISNVGTLVKTGTGSLTLGAPTSYYGATVVNEGLLVLSSPGVLTNSSGLVIGDTGQVRATGNQNVGALFGSSGATLNIDGGTLTVGLTSGRNAALLNELASGGNSTPLSSNYLGTSATALDLGNAAIGSFDTALLGGVPADVADATRLFLQNVAGLSAPDAASLAFAGNITGNGNLTKVGSERLTLTGVNTYTGATAVQGGELRVDFDAISSTSGVAISTGAILAINADNTLDGAGNHDFTRALTGTGLINKVGDGEVTLTGDITGFTGTMNVEEGTLRFNVEQTIPTAVTVAPGATLALDAPTASSVVNYTGTIANNGTIEKDGLGKVILVNAPAPTGNIYVKEGTLSVGAVPTGTLDIASGATYELRVPGTGQPGAPMSFTGELTGVTGSVFSFARGDSSSTLVSDYLVTLAPNPSPSTFAGTLRGDNVTLVMGADNILPTASIDLINGAVLDLNGTTQSFTGLSGDATSQISLANGTLTFDVADTPATPDLVFAGNVTGPGFINKDGLGTLSLRGVTTGSVTFTVHEGTLESTPGALGAGNGVFVDAGAVFAVRNDDTSTAIQFDNGVNGAGTFAKTGAGEVQIGSVTVSGGVAVQEGRLTITGATGSAVFRSVDIAAGATYQVNLPAGGLIHDSDTLDAVTGAGNLAVSGPETLTLAGATQSYTGNTILMNGATLDLATNGVVSLNGLDSGTRDAADIHVTDSGLGTTVNTTGTLTVIQSRYGVFDGQFTPATALTVQGTAALEITGDLAAHGLSSVTVDAGILKVDTANTTAVDLINAGELRVNVTGANETYSGVVTSGDNTGRFVKSGTGTLDFASTVAGGALDNFTGTVGVVEGVLRLDTATLGANVTGLTTDGTGTLELGASAPSRVDLAITGTGAVTIVGPQKVSFGDGVTTGVTGNPYVLQSTGLLTVASGATLGGVFNTSGDLVVASGGTLTPGNSPGTVVVGGNFNLAVGGTLEVEINATTSDQVIVTGSATLAGALVVKQDSTPGSAKPGKGQTYTILTAAGGITGSFSNAVGGVVQLAPDEIAKTGIARVRIQNTGTTLTMTTVGSIAGLAGIHDGLGGLVASIDAGTLPTAVQAAVDGAAPGSVATIVNNLSPLGYAAEYAMAQDADNRLHSALHDRLEQRRYDRASSMTLDEAEWEAFASATGSFADNKQATDTPTFNYRTFGGIAGLDKKLSDDLTVGAAVAYDTGTADIHDNGGRIEMSRATLTVFGGTQVTSRWYVDGGLTAGYGQFDGKRETVLGKLKATNDGMSVGGFVETGTIFAVTKDFHITPYAGAAYTHHEFDGFTENGATGVNASALKTESWSNDSLRVKVGSGFAWFVPLDEVKLKLGLDAAFAHELIDTDSEIEASFASGGSKFTTTAAALPQDSVALTPSIGVQIDESLSASFGYSYEMGFDGRSYQSVNFTVRKRF